MMNIIFTLLASMWSIGCICLTLSAIAVAYEEYGWSGLFLTTTLVLPIGALMAYSPWYFHQ